jgi:hypothetical protein
MLQAAWIRQPPRLVQPQLKVIPAMTNAEAEGLQDLICLFLVESGLPWTLVEKSTFHAILNKVRPGSSAFVGTRRNMSGHILDGLHMRALATQEVRMKKQLGIHRPALLVDGWQSKRNKIHIEGVVCKMGMEVFTIQFEYSGTEHHALAVATLWEKLAMAGFMGQNYSYVCSDNAGQCLRARNILALRYPHMLWLPPSDQFHG